MKLYDVPRNTYIRLEGDEEREVFKFIKIDGMYSLCYNEAGEIVHLAAWTEVKIVS